MGSLSQEKGGKKGAAAKGLCLVQIDETPGQQTPAGPSSTHTDNVRAARPSNKKNVSYRKILQSLHNVLSLL